MRIPRKHHTAGARSAFTLVLVLALFAVVSGLVLSLPLYAGQMARSGRDRQVDLELRLMIDAGADYARLRHSDWQAGDEPVVLTATEMVRGDRDARLVLEPVFDAAGSVRSVAVTAQIELPRDRVRSLTCGVDLLE